VASNGWSARLYWQWILYNTIAFVLGSEKGIQRDGVDGRARVPQFVVTRPREFGG
jgi:hypothetical protein